MIKPMLAYKVGKKEVDWTKRVFMQPKLDGVRCNIFLDEAGEIVSFSRTGKRFFNLKHIEESLQEFFKHNAKVVLDGELYNHDLRDNFELIISLVRKQKPTDEDRSKAREMIQFHCYDYMTEQNTDDYSKRLDQLVCSDMYNAHVVYVPTILIESGMALAQHWHKEFLELGYEGSILRLDKPYENKRSYNLQKFKDFHDTEADIVGYVQGKGKRTGTLGKFIMEDDEGVVFGCPPGKGYNYKDLADILENIDEYVGKRATFTYFERTKANSYRHPQFKAIRNYE